MAERVDSVTGEASTIRLPSQPGDLFQGGSVLQDCLVYDTIPITESDRGLVTEIIALHQLASKGDRSTRPEVRSRRDRRASRSSYKKAKAYYGKTYIITQYQLWSALAVMIGSVLVLSGLLFSCYIWLLDQASLLQL